MTTDKIGGLWLLATFLLITIIVISSLFIWMRHDEGQSITISSPATPNFQGDIYIDGAVNNPGIYPLRNDDSITNLIQTSGGANANADLLKIHLYIPVVSENLQPQKIDINRAEVWLLQALPDIGQTRAQAIVDYRQQNGPFRNIEEINQVKGINNTTFDKIKDFITVTE